MPRSAREPLWLNRTIIDAIHHTQIIEHGGLSGIRDENALESALARPRHKSVYGNVRDLNVLAAAYGFGIVTNHPYVDGNKRVGFLAIVTFRGINGRSFNAPDAAVLDAILGLASGRISEEQLGAWIRRS